MWESETYRSGCCQTLGGVRDRPRARGRDAIHSVISSSRQRTDLLPIFSGSGKYSVRTRRYRVDFDRAQPGQEGDGRGHSLAGGQQLQGRVGPVRDDHQFPAEDMVVAGPVALRLQDPAHTGPRSPCAARGPESPPSAGSAPCARCAVKERREERQQRYNGVGQAAGHDEPLVMNWVILPACFPRPVSTSSCTKSS